MFQTIDNNSKCTKIYHNGQIVDYSPTLPLSSTWSYYKYLENHAQTIQYAQFYNNMSISESCPQHLKEEWQEISTRMKNFYKSFKHIKMDEHICLYELIPEYFIIKLCEVKNKICAHVIENCDKPYKYELNLELCKLLTDIENRQLNITDKQYVNKYIKYKINGTVTQRLTTKKGSFPILTMSKNKRDILVPVNDYFLSLDINAAEVRTLYGILGREQPHGDIYQNFIDIFKNGDTREQMKLKYLKWIYDLNKNDNDLDKLFNRAELLKNFYVNGQIETLYKEKINCDEHSAINYKLQSCQSEIFFEQVIKVYNYLKSIGSKSFITFLIHDNIVLDIDKNENVDVVKKIVDIFEETRYGKYMVKTKIGKNFGQMKEW